MGLFWRCVAPLSTLIVLASGCARVDPRLDYERAARHIAGATGHTDIYQPGRDELARRKVEDLLSGGLTNDEAVAVCLLNNPGLQADFYDVGISRADVVQSGLMSNPSLGISLGFPAGGGLASMEGGLAQNIADLWQIPIRKRAAERSLDRAILELARKAADLAADAKAAYFDAVGAAQTRQIAQENFEIAKGLLKMALARQQAGAATEIDVNLTRSLGLDAELAVEAATLAAANARRTLAELLGIEADAAQLVLLDPLPEIPPAIPAAADLIDQARRSRLDLRAARQAVLAAEARLREQYRLILPNVEVGFEFERAERQSQGGRDIAADTARASMASGGLAAPDIQPRSERRTHTDFTIGPSIGLELPIFDQNQAQIAKARYECAQARKLAEVLDRAIVQEISGAVDRARTAWRLATIYRDRSVPLAQDNLDLSRKAYQAGQVSFLAVLEAQRFFLDSRGRYVDASRTAAMAIPDLERAIGLPYSKLSGKTDAAATADSRPARDQTGENDEQ